MTSHGQMTKLTHSEENKFFIEKQPIQALHPHRREGAPNRPRGLNRPRVPNRSKKVCLERKGA